MQRADKRKHHYIYKITRDDGRYYIGMHSTDDLDDGYFGSGQLLWHSIRKHGRDRHTKEILEFLLSRKELKDREKELVNADLLKDHQCMNLREGGEGWSGESASKAASLSNSSPNRNRSVTAAKAAQTIAERKAQGLYAPDTFGGWTGKSHREETKTKMSASHQGKHEGEKNSQFGTCWVTDGVKPIKIKKEQLDEFLAMGYCRGRVAR